MKSVFISHSRADSDKAMLLTDLLSSEGFEVFRANQLVSGSDWQAGIISAIRRCSVLVALVDQPTPNVMLELGYALGAAKQVMLVGSLEARIPFDMASLPVVRFDSLDPSSLFELADVLRSRLREEAPPTHLIGGRNNLVYMLESSDYLDGVPPREFESFVLEFLQELGFEAEQTPLAFDGGYDIFVKLSNVSFTAIVKVKKYTGSSKVGLAHVRQLLGAMTISGILCGILITTSEFTSSAHSMAERSPLPIQLLTLEELVNSTQETITTASS